MILYKKELGCTSIEVMETYRSEHLNKFYLVILLFYESPDKKDLVGSVLHSYYTNPNEAIERAVSTSFTEPGLVENKTLLESYHLLLGKPTAEDRELQDLYENQIKESSFTNPLK